MNPEIEDYIFRHYRHLWNHKEIIANALLLRGLDTDEHADPEKRKELIQFQKTLGFSAKDEEIKRLICGGWASFKRDLVQRLMDECSQEIFINVCTRCGAVARTPLASQCPRCFFFWR